MKLSILYSLTKTPTAFTRGWGMRKNAKSTRFIFT